MSNYHLLDQPLILRNAFFPRRGLSTCPDNAFDLSIPAENLSLHCRFYGGGGSDSPTILYFHGNGEIVSDYDGIAPLYYSGAGANLAVAEYRGYGAAGGTPTFSAMLEDAHRYFAAVKGELKRRNYADSLYIMGRSLGSVSALELAAAYTGESEGLIIESGFTSATRIARRLGFTMPPQEMDLLEQECRQKVQGITLPALVIHGESDSLVPLQEAETLYGLLGSDKKDLVVIAWADHNSLIFEGEAEYFSAISRFTGRK
jgi:uncharacterized protein